MDFPLRQRRRYVGVNSFHATKHFKVKKWVRSETSKDQTPSFDDLLKHAKEHEATIKDFNWHKSNRGVAQMTTINEIKSFKFKKGNGYKPKGSNGKTCGKCGASHPSRECLTWGRKCHKCGNKNHFSTCCRLKQKGPQDSSKNCPWGRSKSRGRKGKGKPSRSRSRSVSFTCDAHSTESSSFQHHPDDPHGDFDENLHGDNSFQERP